MKSERKIGDNEIGETNFMRKYCKSAIYSNLKDKNSFCPRQGFWQFLRPSGKQSGLVILGLSLLLTMPISSQAEPTLLTPQNQAQPAADENAPEANAIQENTTENPKLFRRIGFDSLNEDQKRGLASEHYHLGAYYLNHFSFKLATAELDQAVIYRPNLNIAHRDLCLASLGQGNFSRAFAEFLMVVGVGEATPYNQASRLKLDKIAGNLHYNKGLEEAKANNYKNARSELLWSIYYEPLSAKTHGSLAFLEASYGNYKAAEKEYAITFALNPNDPYSKADFANMLARKGDFKRALENLREAVNLSPKQAALHVDLAWLLEYQGDISQASQQYQEAVNISPTHPWLWTHLGTLLEKQGKRTDAANAYRKALELNPNMSEAKEHLAKLLASSI